MNNAEWRANAEAQPPIDFSPDEYWLAVASTDDATWLWKVDDLVMRSVAIPITIPFGSTVRAVKFSPDGNWLAVGGDTISLWEVQTLRKNPTAAPWAEMRPGADAFVELAFSPDSRLLAATSQNRTLLWDMNAFKHDPHIKPVEIHGIPRSHDFLAFGPKGEWLAILGSPGSSGHLSLWTVASDLRVQQACAIAGRNFTNEEWQRYFPGAFPRPTCPAWPVPARGDDPVSR